MPGTLEHLNVTVADPQKTAAMLCDLFDWRVRWEGPGMETGYTVHVGDEGSYLALFSFGQARASEEVSYDRIGALNHIGVVVEDVDAVEAKVKALGYRPKNHGDYEPGRRFYFDDENGLEIEVVSYA
ncbi:MAG: VOC family protein [Pseudomonadota bacterium]